MRWTMLSKPFGSLMRPVFTSLLLLLALPAGAFIFGFSGGGGADGSVQYADTAGHADDITGGFGNDVNLSGLFSGSAELTGN